MAYTGSGTADSGMGSLMTKFYDKKALETLRASVVVYNLCDKKPIPQNTGKTMIFHRYAASSGTVSAYLLTEGTAPTAGAVSAAEVTATLLQFGNHKQTSDFLEMTAISDIVRDTLTVMMDDAANIIDREILDIAYGVSASAGGTAVPSGAGFGLVYPSAQGYAITALSTLTSACFMDVNGIKRAVKALEIADARPKEDGYFHMIIHPASKPKLTSDPQWQDAYKYTDPQNMRRGEIGRIAGVTVTMTTNIFWTTSGTGSAGTTSAYFSLILGKGSLAVSEIDGGLKTFVKRPNNYDSSNPLDQWSTIGWKITFIPVILNSNCGKILVTAD